MPGDKVAKVEELLAAQEPGGCLAFVGDGINDAPVLSPRGHRHSHGRYGLRRRDRGR